MACDVSWIIKTKLQFRNWTSDILQAWTSIEKQIKVRAEAEQIVQHENTSDRHWDLTFYLILRRGEGDKRGKNLWLSEMLRTLPSSGKKWGNVSLCGGAARCSMGYIHWSKPFCRACIWLSLAERKQNIDWWAVQKLCDQQTPLGMDWKCPW